MTIQRLTGRKRLSTGIALLLLLAVLASAWQAPSASAASTQAAAGCSGKASPALTEGPYYKTGSPESTNLVKAGMSGTQVTLTGYVYDKNCNPIANAWLDFWQADANGTYDNSGYTLRGHQYTDASGKYTLVTVVPGEYPGRTVHIHVKVQSPGGPLLTTQLFFPGVADNSSDSIYSPDLLVAVQDTASGKTAAFNFVLNVVSSTVTPTATPTTPTATSHTFQETGFTVSGDFWTAWQGGRSYADSLYINGLPITAARNEVSPTDGKTYLTQWFERARFEYHPENAAPNNVLLGLLGTVSAKAVTNRQPFAAITNPGGTLTWYSQTGHTLGDTTTGGKAIAAAWTRLGGLSQFGYPISQPFMEVSKDDGKTYLVQYFERQRLEYHPENAGTAYEVLLGRLGAEQLPTTP